MQRILYGIAINRRWAKCCRERVEFFCLKSMELDGAMLRRSLMVRYYSTYRDVTLGIDIKPPVMLKKRIGGLAGIVIEITLQFGRGFKTAILAMA